MAAVELAIFVETIDESPTGGEVGWLARVESDDFAVLPAHRGATLEGVLEQVAESVIVAAGGALR